MLEECSCCIVPSSAFLRYESKFRVSDVSLEFVNVSDVIRG